MLEPAMGCERCLFGPEDGDNLRVGKNFGVMHDRSKHLIGWHRG